MPKIPSNALVELSTAVIGEGDLVKEVDRRLIEGHEALKKHFERTQNRKGKVTITARIEMSYDPKIDKHVSIEHSVDMKVPKVNRSILVKEREGKLLVRADGALDIDQLRLFDEEGKALGVYNADSGEINQEPAVAGKIVGA